MGFEIKLRHSYPGLDLDIDLSGQPGVTVLFGPSGAGKTTVIRAVAGLLAARCGRVSVAGRVLFDSASGANLPANKRRMGYVFQDGRLFPHLSVMDNLQFARRFARTPVAIAPLVDLLGLAPLLDRRPATLSGGEAQRVAFARAMLSDPDMLLMDEPLAALDGPRKEAILPWLDRLKSETGVPVLYVTHSVEEVARLADRVAILDKGRIVQQGDVFDILSDPAAMPYFGVRDAGSVLRAKVLEHADDGLTRLDTSAGPLELPGVLADPGQTVRLRLPARDIILATERPKGLSARNILPATIEGIEPGRGPGAAVVLRAGSDRLLARITERSRHELGLEPGQEIFAILKASTVARGDISGRS